MKSFLVLAAVLVGSTVAAEPTPVAGVGDIRPLLQRQLALYPKMEIQDCYKLLFQACLGSEHAVGDAAGATRWMEREWASLGEGPAEPPIDPISPDGKLVRVNLRPLKERKGDAAALVQAFVATANGFRGSRETLAAAWAQLVTLAESGAIPFSAADVRAFGEKQAAAGYPAVHHSARYNALYRPAYRVVAREFLPKELQ